MPRKYLEFKVTLDDNGEIIDKKLTDRKSVSISQFDADINNSNVVSSLLFYELAPEKEQGKQNELTYKQKKIQSAQDAAVKRQ